MSAALVTITLVTPALAVVNMVYVPDGSAGSNNYSVTSGYENLPVAHVTWFDVARFSNGLVNGQGNGSMKTGGDTLSSGQHSGIVTANPDAQIRIPTKGKWYKAAYYNGGTGTCSLYPDGKNTITPAEANYCNAMMMIVVLVCMFFCSSLVFHR